MRSPANAFIVARRGSVADHPRPFRWKGLGPIRRSHRRLGPRARTAAATRRMLQALIVARAARLVLGALVHVHRAARSSLQQSQSWCRRKHPPAGTAALGAGGRFIALGHCPKRVESTAGGAVVFIGWHRNYTFKSYEIGMSILPSRNFVGPAAVGLMSKSKICVGSHKVAQAFGTSTTPLICPCTGAVPRIE